MTLSRTRLVKVGRDSFTEDTHKALMRVAGSFKDYRLGYSGCDLDAPGCDVDEPLKLLARTGRLVHNVTLDEDDDTPEVAQRKEDELWARFVPEGFVPWDRFPRGDSPTRGTFFYPGPWQPLIDSLLSEGLGQEALPSFATAAMLDIGQWEGDRETERFVQAQLHRIGMPCGPITGIIEERTAALLRSLGMDVPLEKAAEILCEYETPQVSPKGERVYGHIVMPGVDFSVQTVGAVEPLKQPAGLTLSIEGRGRVILDIREGTT